MITASMSTFHRVYAGSNPPSVPVTDGINRSHGFQTNGELLQIPNARNMDKALVASRVSRRSDTSEL